MLPWCRRSNNAASSRLSGSTKKRLTGTSTCASGNNCSTASVVLRKARYKPIGSGLSVAAAANSVAARSAWRAAPSACSATGSSCFGIASPSKDLIDSDNGGMNGSSHFATWFAAGGYRCRDTSPSTSKVVSTGGMSASIASITLASSDSLIARVSRGSDEASHDLRRL